MHVFAANLTSMDMLLLWKMRKNVQQLTPLETYVYSKSTGGKAAAGVIFKQRRSRNVRSCFEIG